MAIGLTAAITSTTVTTIGTIFATTATAATSGVTSTISRSGIELQHPSEGPIPDTLRRARGLAGRAALEVAPMPELTLFNHVVICIPGCILMCARALAYAGIWITAVETS